MMTSSYSWRTDICVWIFLSSQHSLHCWLTSNILKIIRILHMTHTLGWTNLHICSKLNAWPKDLRAWRTLLYFRYKAPQVIRHCRQFSVKNLCYLCTHWIFQNADIGLIGELTVVIVWDIPLNLHHLASAVSRNESNLASSSSPEYKHLRKSGSEDNLKCLSSILNCGGSA